MTRRSRTLSAAFVRTVNRPGVYGDGRGGRGLSLRVHRTLDGRITKTWRQRVRIEGRLTSIGLGPYPEVTLAEARQKALDNSRGVLLGQDPRGRGVPTFAEAAERTIELHREAWKEGSPLPEQWESTFRLHAALLLDKRVDRIESADVLRCLSPIWNSKPAAARKARHRIAAVFRWCIGRNYRPDNPVDRAVEALPKVNGNTTSHHRALPHAEVGAALRAVRGTTDTHPSAVPCVELIVLTAVRPGEARGARWGEIDMDAGVWTIPASRMKAGREFAVPLSTGALDVLERARKLSGGSPLVFPSRTGGPLPSKAPLRVLRRAGVDSTLHGLTSSTFPGTVSTPTVVRTRKTAGSVSFRGLDRGETYYVRAKASNDDGESRYTANESETIPLPAPDPPDVTLRASSGAVIVQLQSTGATSFTAQLSESSSFPSSGRLTLSTTGSQVTFRNLTPGKRYYVRANATGPGGTSGWSGTENIVVPLDAPTLTLLAPLPGRISATVTSVPGATGYRIEISQHQFFSSGVRSATRTSAGTSTFSGLATGTWYGRARATRGTVVSKWSSRQSVTVRSEPGPP